MKIKSRSSSVYISIVYTVLMSLIMLIPLSESQGQEINDNPFRSEPSPDYGQSGISDVVGTYVNPEIGFQIDLPKDWKGEELKDMVSVLVFAFPNEISLSEPETLPGTLMTISITNQETFNKVASLLTTLNITSSYGNNISCNNLQPSFVSINGINAEQISQECKDEEGADLKTKAYAFSTQDDSLIEIGFTSNSTSSYDQHLSLFEESVKTIKISQPGDIATSQTYKKAKDLRYK